MPFAVKAVTRVSVASGVPAASLTCAQIVFASGTSPVVAPRRNGKQKEEPDRKRRQVSRRLDLHDHVLDLCVLVGSGDGSAVWLRSGGSVAEGSRVGSGSGVGIAGKGGPKLAWVIPGLRICGVTVTINSLRVCVTPTSWNSRPMSGRSPRIGIF